MSEPLRQDLHHHGRLDFSFHVVLSLVLLVTVVFAVVHFAQARTVSAAWLIVLSLASIIPYIKLRTYPLKVQDRIIRLEERLRLQALAPAAWHAQIYKLTEDQLIGLRFASDEEVVELAKQALEQGLDRKQIKERIRDWRPDFWRV